MLCSAQSTANVGFSKFSAAFEYNWKRPSRPAAFEWGIAGPCPCPRSCRACTCFASCCCKSTRVSDFHRFFGWYCGASWWPICAFCEQRQAAVGYHRKQQRAIWYHTIRVSSCGSRWRWQRQPNEPSRFVIDRMLNNFKDQMMANMRKEFATSAEVKKAVNAVAQGRPGAGAAHCSTGHGGSSHGQQLHSLAVSAVPGLLLC